MKIQDLKNNMDELPNPSNYAEHWTSIFYTVDNKLTETVFLKHHDQELGWIWRESSLDYKLKHKSFSKGLSLYYIMNTNCTYILIEINND